MKKISLFLVVMTLILTDISFASDPFIKSSPKTLKDIDGITKTKQKKVFIGGDIGATFGDYTEVRLAPLIGYRFSPQVSGGLKFVYRHSWEKSTNASGAEITIQNNAIGGNAFMQYNPVAEFYTKVEFSYQIYKNQTTQGTEDTGVPFLFLGLGYTKMLAPNVYLNTGIKVDVLNNQDSPFQDFIPFFDVGIGVGI